MSQRSLYRNDLSRNLCQFLVKSTINIYIYILKQVLQKCWEVLLDFHFLATHGGIYNGSAHVSTTVWGDAPWDQRELSSLKETLLLDLLNSWQNLQLITQCWKLCHRNHLMKVLCLQNIQMHFEQVSLLSQSPASSENSRVDQVNDSSRPLKICDAFYDLGMAYISLICT